MRRWQNLLSKVSGGVLFEKDPNGNLIQIPEPSFEDYEDDEEWAPFVCCPDHKMTVTKSGRDFVFAMITSQGLDIASTISEKVSKIFELGYFDTCIREACVQLEHDIKVRIGSKKFGDCLTDEFVDHLRKRNTLLESGIRTFRQELRAVFKLIRNEYMHNLLDADQTSALVVLTRISRMRSCLKEDA
jgi:hypothetical protein